MGALRSLYGGFSLTAFKKIDGRYIFFDFETRFENGKQSQLCLCYHI